MHAVDMSFQSRDLRDKVGLFCTMTFCHIWSMCHVYTFSLQLNCQINEERVLVSYLLNSNTLVIKKIPVLDCSLKRSISIINYTIQTIFLALPKEATNSILLLINSLSDQYK